MEQREIAIRSLELARDLYTSGADKKVAPCTTPALLAIHAHIFKNLCDHAGKVRKLNLSKVGFRFAGAIYLEDAL